MELISREKLKETIEPMVGMFDDDGEIWWTRESILRAINNAPTIEEREEGTWIDKGRDDDVYDIKGVKAWATKGMCSECGFTTWFIESHMCYAYCPQCGSYNATKIGRRHR